MSGIIPAGYHSRLILILFPAIFTFLVTHSFPIRGRDPMWGLKSVNVGSSKANGFQFWSLIFLSKYLAQIHIQNIFVQLFIFLSTVPHFINLDIKCHLLVLLAGLMNSNRALINWLDLIYYLRSSFTPHPANEHVSKYFSCMFTLVESLVSDTVMDEPQHILSR